MAKVRAAADIRADWLKAAKCYEEWASQCTGSKPIDKKSKIFWQECAAEARAKAATYTA